MRIRDGILGAAGTLFFGLSAAQTPQIARTLSTDFLSRLVVARSSNSEIAIVHAQAGSAMIISRHEPRKPVVYLRGNAFLWSQIEEQLAAASRSDEPIHLELQRWTLDRQSCVGLDRKLAQFLAILDGTTTNPGHASTKEQEIWLDATSFRIHMAAKDARLTIAPDGPRNPPLQQATAELHSIVSGCTQSVQPSVERHDL